MKMSAHVAALVLMTAGLIQAVSGDIVYPDTYYLTNYCNRTLLIQGDARVKLSPSSFLSTPRNCLMTLAPRQAGASLIAKFRSYSISYTYANDYGQCPYVALQLYDYNRSPLLNAYFADFCGSRKPTGNYYLGLSGQFRLTTGSSSIIAPSMDLLVTQVIKISPAANCPSNFFDCKNSYCIPNSLTCNGYDDCGNNRDEVEGCGLTPGVIVGIVAGSGFFIFMVVVMLLVIRRYRQRVTYVQYY